MRVEAKVSSPCYRLFAENNPLFLSLLSIGIHCEWRERLELPSFLPCPSPLPVLNLFPPLLPSLLLSVSPIGALCQVVYSQIKLGQTDERTGRNNWPFRPLVPLVGPGRREHWAARDKQKRRSTTCTGTKV